ncbi:DUF6625 family protein [Methylophaga sp.]|uniref:DUF6625 family protein n=1 Tax=Methylophaga sp. TaxID=2024840 RepID=UPI003A910638
MNNKIVIVIPYFGRWPDWINLFIESCKFNHDIDWLFYTDCPLPENYAHNIEYKQISFSAYKQLVSQELEIEFNPKDSYKLCDLKPALGYIHRTEIEQYDFFCFGDLDVIYGDLRYFLTDQLLNKYDVIGTHNLRLSGHFCAFRNNQRNREAFKKIKNWQTYLSNPHHLSLDESKFSKIFVPHRKHPNWLRKLWSISSRHQRKVYFREQYTTILSSITWLDGTKIHPQEWYWYKGKLLNNRNEREFMYLHFMNWKSNRWLPKQYRNKPPAWSKLPKLVNVNWQAVNEDGFQISEKGFTPLKQSIKDKLTKLSNTTNNNLYLLLSIITLQ